METVRHLAATVDDTEDFGATRLRGFETFEHEHACTLRHDEAVAVLGERPGRGLRWIVAGGKRGEQRKADERLLIHRAVGADAQRRGGFAAPDRFNAELDR